MLSEIRKIYIGISVILILHLVGFIGLSIDSSRALINQFTPANLILSSILVFSFHKTWNFKSVLVFLGIGLAGLGFEIIGVNSGLIFGEYQYGNVLGFQLGNVPLVLGILWLNMIYGTWVISNLVSDKLLVKSLIGASLMTFFDLFLEPIAIRLGYWQWDGSVVPIQNFIAWFLISFGLHLLIHSFVKPEKNWLGLSTFVIQTLFFIGLNLTLA